MDHMKSEILFKCGNNSVITIIKYQHFLVTFHTQVYIFFQFL